MIGLSGSHRTGKSTMAKAWAEKHGFAFIPSQASKVLEEKGLSLSANLPFAVRLDAQRHILDAAKKQLESVTGPFISDRTPMDMAAYAMADVMKGTAYGSEHLLEKYVQDCYDVTNLHYDRIVIVPPGIPYVEEPGKPPFDIGYQEHHHLLCIGLICDYRCQVTSIQLDRNTIGLEDRIGILDEQWEEIVAGFKRFNKGHLLH